MKGLIIFIISIFTMGVFSQSNPSAIRFKKTEHFSVSTSIDPFASIKEGGLDILTEIEYNGLMNVKAGVENFQVLQGGYLALTGGIGVNLTHGLREKFVYTGGIRLGVIHRGWLTKDKYPYPLFGFEGQINYNLTENIVLGLRGTYDWREDFLYTGGEPSYRSSGFFTIKYRWKRK